MERIVITGATGFIGASICKRTAKEGQKVGIIAREHSDLSLLKDVQNDIDVYRFDGDLNKLIDYFVKFKPTVIIHLASLYITSHTSEQIETLIDSNIKFATYIMEAAMASGVKKFINTSTSWQYYGNEPHTPASLYAATKQATEDIFSFYADAYDMRVLNLTIYDSYGVGDPRKKIMSLFKRISESGETLQMSGGEQQLELVYIDDIVEAYVNAISNIDKLVDAGAIKSYFLHADKVRTLKEIAMTYEKVSGKKLNIEWGARPYRDREVMKTYSDGEILKGWTPKIVLEEGIGKLLGNV